MGIGVELNNVKTKMMIEMEIQGSISKIAKLYFSQAITFDKLVSDIMVSSKNRRSVFDYFPYRFLTVPIF